MRHERPVAGKDEVTPQAPCDGEALYRWLMQDAGASGGDPFDAHIAASLLAIALAEAQGRGADLTAALGLDPAQLAGFVAQVFPYAVGWPPLAVPGARPERTADEACLLDLLTRCTTSGTAFQGWLAAIMARRAQRPNHLWQDLGLRNRGELSQLMKRHFKPLALRNSQDMKWKKFLYRMICADASYTLCTAPSCAECDDFSLCFGDETGESMLAQTRRAAETGA